MKKKISAVLIGLVLVSMIIPQIAFGAFNDKGLTWDGKATTLKELSQKTGYDFIDKNGDYAPLYTDYARYLWEIGLLTGSDGTFNLDKPITRVEGAIMVLRLMDKEQEALDAKLTGSFTDVPDWAKYQIAYAAQNGIVSGYSNTTFGSNDTMSANQYITLILRAMGYKDGDDFVWNKAADKALEIGLIGAPCREQYMRSNLFMRDNVAVISYNALNAPMKSGAKLSDNLQLIKKVTGDVPYATLALKQAATGSTPSSTPNTTPPAQNGSANSKISLTSGGGGRLTMEYTSSGQGGVAGAVGYTTMQVGDYSGSLDIVYTVNGVSKTHTVNIDKNTTYTLTYTYPATANNDTSTYQPGQKIMTGTDPITKMPIYTEMPGKTTTIPGATVSNSITISAGGSTCSETASIKGTLSTGSLSISKN